MSVAALPGVASSPGSGVGIAGCIPSLYLALDTLPTTVLILATIALILLFAGALVAWKLRSQGGQAALSLEDRANDPETELETDDRGRVTASLTALARLEDATREQVREAVEDEFAPRTAPLSGDTVTLAPQALSRVRRQLRDGQQ